MWATLLMEMDDVLMISFQDRHSLEEASVSHARLLLPEWMASGVSPGRLSADRTLPFIKSSTA